MAREKEEKCTVPEGEGRSIRPTFRIDRAVECEIPTHVRTALNGFTAIPTENAVRESIRLANELTLQKVRGDRRTEERLCDTIVEVGDGQPAAQIEKQYDPIPIVIPNCNVAETVQGTGNGSGIAVNEADAVEEAKNKAEGDARAQAEALRPVCPSNCRYLAPGSGHPQIQSAQKVLSVPVPIVVVRLVQQGNRIIIYVYVVQFWIAFATAEWEVFFICTDKPVAVA